MLSFVEKCVLLICLLSSQLSNLHLWGRPPLSEYCRNMIWLVLLNIYLQLFHCFGSLITIFFLLSPSLFSFRTLATPSRQFSSESSVLPWHLTAPMACLLFLPWLDLLSSQNNLFQGSFSLLTTQSKICVRFFYQLFQYIDWFYILLGCTRKFIFNSSY